MNKAILMGRLTKDPELRVTKSDIEVASFTLAVDRRFKNSQGEKETDFIPIVAWRQQADFARRFLAKGSRVAVIGSMQNRSWEDNDGNKRTVTEVIADEVYFADSKRDGTHSEFADPHRVTASQSVNVAETDEALLPFDL